MAGTNQTPNHRENLAALSTITGQSEYLSSTNNILNVNIASGGGSGGTSSTFGSTFPTVGTAIGAISSTGTMAGLNLDSSGNLKISGTISVGSTTDESAFTAGTSTLSPSGGVFNDSVASLSSGQQGTVRLTAPRAIHSNLRNNSGTEIATSSNPLRIDPTGTTGQPVLNSELADVTGTITNATQTTPVVATGLAGYDNVLISIHGTYGTATATFQGSDDGGVTFYNLVATRTDTAVIEAGFTSLTNVTRAWNVNIQGFDNVQVLPSAVASGTVNVRISPEAAPTPNGVTVTANGGTNLNTSALALESGGNLATIAGAVTSAVLQTNMKQINGVVPLMGNGVSGTGSQRVNIASDNTAFSVNATLSAETTKVIGTVNISAAQTVGLVAGTALVGKVGIDQTTAGTTNNVEVTGHGGSPTKDDTQFGDGVTTGVLSTTNRLYNGSTYDRPRGVSGAANTNLTPTASGGWTPYFANAITTTVAPTAAAGKFGGYMLINLNATPAYLQVFDTTGAVTLGTTPPTFVIPIPANATAANGLAANLELANGIKITNGIKCAATTTSNGATPVSTGLSGTLWVL